MVKRGQTDANAFPFHFYFQKFTLILNFIFKMSKNVGFVWKDFPSSLSFLQLLNKKSQLADKKKGRGGWPNPCSPLKKVFLFYSIPHIN